MATKKPDPLYTDYHKELYRQVFTGLNKANYFNRFWSHGLPFEVNQDPHGAYNVAFALWMAAREQAIDEMLGLLEGTDSVEQVRLRLKGQRRLELGDFDGRDDDYRASQEMIVPV
jgi:hypothetical protein